MKKIFLLGLIASAFLIGCSDETGGTTPGGESTTKAPTTYTQKALLEYFSGTWCQFCPDGKVFYENIKQDLGENFSSVVYHLGDNMDNASDNAIDDTYAAGYPSGMINRVGGEAVSRTTWGSTAAAVLDETAKCGLAIDATDASNIKVTVGVGEQDLDEGNYFLTVLLVEKSVIGSGTGYDQVNYYNGVSGHPYFGAGNPIVGYEHTNVVRLVLTDALGDKVSADAVKAGALTEFSFPASADTFEGEVEVVAFLSESTTNLANPGASTSYIYNVQRADVGSNQDFD